MGQVYTSGKRGGKPKQIDGFTGSMQIITETTTWTCPATGEYYISCIGQGGSNAGGYKFGSVGWTGFVGNTGGGGGISESKLSLKKGDSVIITINAGTSSFGNYLSATGGQNADYIRNVGSGGSGKGGNIGNFKGVSGTRSMDDDAQGGGTNTKAKYGGAKGGVVIDSNKTASFSACPTPANLGMYPYGSSQGTGFGDGNFEYGDDRYVKNGAVIIEYMG